MNGVKLRRKLFSCLRLSCPLSAVERFSVINVVFEMKFKMMIEMFASNPQRKLLRFDGLNILNFNVKRQKVSLSIWMNFDGMAQSFS